jgi:hypothetical protein
MLIIISNECRYVAVVLGGATAAADDDNDDAVSSL